MSDYVEFINSKRQWAENSGFSPLWIPDFLFDFQKFLVQWAIEKGRSAILADCGLGKGVMQLVWAENIVRKTNRPVLIATPIAVGQQTLKEAEKFGIAAKRTRDGKMTDEACVWITNYEQLHKYDPSKFAGFVGDESAVIKDFKTKTKATVTEFTRRIPYRLLCTATAAPNDYWELGTSSEVLGYLGFRDMITTFFRQETSKDYLGWGRTKYRFRGHAEQPFWSWVCSWARSLRRPSDLGFDDSRFDLPELTEIDHILEEKEIARPGVLWGKRLAQDMQEERKVRRDTIVSRCEKAAELALSTEGHSVCWVELNDEGDTLEKMIPGCVQVSGSTPDEKKEEFLTAFSEGQIKRLVIKPKIGGHGLNWQFCQCAIVFPSHSFESYYQLVRRFYRFGQLKPVEVHRVLTESEKRVLANLKRKQDQTEKMFSDIVSHMQDSMHLVSQDYFPEKERLPNWLLSTKS